MFGSGSTICKNNEKLAWRKGFGWTKSLWGRKTLNVKPRKTVKGGENCTSLGIFKFVAGDDVTRPKNLPKMATAPPSYSQFSSKSIGTGTRASKNTHFQNTLLPRLRFQVQSGISDPKQNFLLKLAARSRKTHFRLWFWWWWEGVAHVRGV